jgi:hypothetical protein
VGVAVASVEGVALSEAEAVAVADSAGMGVAVAAHTVLEVEVQACVSYLMGRGKRVGQGRKGGMCLRKPPPSPPPHTHTHTNHHHSHQSPPCPRTLGTACS